MIRIGLLGAEGRMGTQVLAVAARPEWAARLAIAERWDRARPADGPGLARVDVLIDFASPAALLDALDVAAGAGARPAVVTGSTGWTPEQEGRLRAHARELVILRSANFAPGLLALRSLLQAAAPALASLGFAARLTETHHVHKRDAPSGTALALARALQPAYPVPLPIESRREGEALGTHAVEFDGPFETLTFHHDVKDRAVFAAGALDAALWISTQRSKGLLDESSYWSLRFSPL